MSTIKHGTHSGYTNQACRCDLCRQASSAYHRKHRDARIAAGTSAAHDRAIYLRRIGSKATA